MVSDDKDHKEQRSVRPGSVRAEAARCREKGCG